MSKVCEADLGKMDFKGKYKLAIWTDHADFIGSDGEVTELDKLLELRAFDEKGETRFFRSCVGEDFFIREIADGTEAKDGVSFDQKQFLDIDETRKTGDPSIRFTTGGGCYHLPVSDAKKLTVRYYYKYDDDGVAYVCDKRLVGFEKGEVK